MIKFLTVFAFVVGSLLGSFGFAQASFTVHIGSAPTSLVDSTKAAFYVEETATADGGTYKIFNNTTNYDLIGFGVTNPNTNAYAVIGSGYSQTGIVFYSYPDVTNYWQALNLYSGNWNSQQLRGGSTAATLFGTIGSVLGSEGYANYYETLDANPLRGTQYGSSAWGFGFKNAPTASQAFGVAYGPDGLMTFYSAPVVAPVPLPAAFWLLGSGLAAIGILRKKIM